MVLWHFAISDNDTIMKTALTLCSRTVMLDPDNVKLVCSLLTPDMNVLEYGSGGSTTFFRCQVDQLTLLQELVDHKVVLNQIFLLIPSFVTEYLATHE